MESKTENQNLTAIRKRIRKTKNPKAKIEEFEQEVKKTKADILEMITQLENDDGDQLESQRVSQFNEKFKTLLKRYPNFVRHAERVINQYYTNIYEDQKHKPEDQ